MIYFTAVALLGYTRLRIRTGNFIYLQFNGDSTVQLSGPRGPSQLQND